MTLHVARAGWDLDLRHGEAREDALVHTFLRSKVEVKSDGIARRTGNVFIEFRHRGQPSGISITTATRWAIEYDDDQWLIVPTDLVRELAREALQEDRRTVGGDDYASEGALVPLAWFTRRRRESGLELVRGGAA